MEKLLLKLAVHIAPIVILYLLVGSLYNEHIMYSNGTNYELLLSKATDPKKIMEYSIIIFYIKWWRLFLVITSIVWVYIFTRYKKIYGKKRKRRHRNVKY